MVQNKRKVQNKRRGHSGNNQTKHSVTDDDDDDGDTVYSHFSASSGLKKHKVKLRPRFSEKIIWDGRRTTFKPLMELLEGHLRQINGSYMIDPEFLQRYATSGDYLRSRSFRTTYQVTHPQARYDRQYLFGILQTVTRAG